MTSLEVNIWEARVDTSRVETCDSCCIQIQAKYHLLRAMRTIQSWSAVAVNLPMPCPVRREICVIVISIEA